MLFAFFHHADICSDGENHCHFSTVRPVAPNCTSDRHIPCFMCTVEKNKPKKMYRWQTSIWKYAPHYMSSGNCEVKQQRDSSTHPWEQPKYMTPTPPNACWGGWGAPGTPAPCWWECEMVLPLWKTVWWLLTKLNILLPYDPTITLWYLFKEWKTYVHTKSCNRMFTAALFKIAKIMNNLLLRSNHGGFQ